MKRILVLGIIASTLSINVFSEEIPNKIYKLEDIESRYIENPFAVFMRADKIMKSEDPDYNLAVELFEKASKMGILEATHNLGNMYYYGIGVDKDINKASNYLYISGSEGLLESQLLLADIYARKNVNLRQAYKWYYMAAKQNVPEAKYYIANMLFYAKGTGMDTELALKLYDEVIKDTNSRKTMFEVGEIYYNGINNPRNYEKAAKYYEESAKLGYLKSEKKIAHMYEYGKGVKRNLEKAFFWYNSAALKNDFESMSKLGDMYRLGEGTQFNIDEAIKYYEKAGKYNDKNSLYQLASIYMKNEYKINPDYNRAISYYIKAVNAGHKESMRELALIYRKGIENIIEIDNFKYKDLMNLYYKDEPKKEIKKFELFNFKDDQIDYK